MIIVARVMEESNSVADHPTRSRLPKPIRVPIFDLLIERKTDILAFVAFLLAVGSVITQSYFFVQGSMVSLIPPNQVLLNFVPTRDPNDDRHFLRIAARMAYVNSGQKGSSSVIEREWVSFTLNQRTYNQHAHSETKISDFDYDNELEFDFVEVVGPQPIEGGSSFSREVYFAPYPTRLQTATNSKRAFDEANFLYYEDVISDFIEAREMQFAFYFKVLGKKRPRFAQCKVYLDEASLKHLVQYGWSSPICWHDVSGHFGTSLTPGFPYP